MHYVFADHSDVGFHLIIVRWSEFRSQVISPGVFVCQVWTEVQRAVHCSLALALTLSRALTLSCALSLWLPLALTLSHTLSHSLSLVLSLFVSLSDHQRSTRDSRLPETLRVIKTSLAKLLPLLWSPLSRDKLHTSGILQTNKTNASTIFSIWCVRRLLLSLFVYLEKQHLSSLPPMIGDITWQVNLHFTAH